MRKNFTTAAIESTPAELATRLVRLHPRTLGMLSTMIRHPRSLARPMASWRPPSVDLPRVPGHSPLTATLTRHRAGPRARARVLGYGEEREPAYVISVRITDPGGADVSPSHAESWMRALIGNDSIDTVHEISNEVSPTFVWLVDGTFQPLRSPASLFAGFRDFRSAA